MAKIPPSSASPEDASPVRSMIPGRTRACAIFALGVACALTGCRAETPDSVLLRTVGAARATPDDEGLVLREMDLEVNLELLAGPGNERLRIQLPDKAIVEAVREQHEAIAGGGHTWSGHISDEPGSSVVLASRGDSLVGTVRTQAGKLYRIVPSPQDQVIQELDPAGFPPEGEADEIPTTAPTGPVAISSPSCNDDPNTIDVLVVYTEDARNGADPSGTGGTGPIEAMIYVAMAETNQSYLKSEIAQRLRLVHVQQVSYTESGDVKTDRDRLVAMGDSHLEDVPNLRDLYGADVVVLLVESSVECGRAYIMNNTPEFEKWAYSVVKRSCSIGNYTFGHELGHLMSARHDWVADPKDNLPFHYNHGHLNTAPSVGGVSPWRTMMSYKESCGGVNCIRINYWSNPGLRYPWSLAGTGDLLGAGHADARPTDNHLALNTTASLVANFRCETPPPQGTRVWMKDAWSDSGLEPDPGTAGLPMWQSPYIWIRRVQDPTLLYQHSHQMPLASQTNWIYVKLHNSSQIAASGDLEVWSADASTSLDWPVDWQRIGTVPIGAVAAESTMTAELPWQPTGMGHFCLLARWVSAQDPMTFPEGSWVGDNVRSNNNLIWKNVNVIDLLAITDATLEFRSRGSAMNFMINAPSDERRPSFLTHGIVDVRLDAHTSSAWRSAGSHGAGFTEVGEFLRIGREGARLEGIGLPEGREGRVHIRLQRLPTTPAEVFVLDVVQLDGDTVVGGVTYEIHTPEAGTRSGRPAEAAQGEAR